MSDDQERLIAAALEAGLITEAQVEEARGIQKTVAEIGIQQALTDILVKKEHLTEEQLRSLQREAASQRIGKYEIVEKIGSGGAGVVYRARHATLGRVVALKVLSNTRASDPQYLDRFVREARIAVTLNHRNIVRGLDYGESGGYHYFVMEFVPGDTLYEVIQREGRVEESRVLEIGIQVARALEHALQYDLSHRDLKPDNILMSVESSEAKVCDLGLAKPRKLETSAGQGTSSAIGTPSYIAPEQIRGIDQADTRSDIYSLGATLFHAACGRPPFEGKSVEELLRQHLQADPPDPREIVVELSSGFAAVLLKMLEKDPKNRYQKLGDLIADLEAVRDGRPPVHTLAFARKGPSVTEGRSRAELARQGGKPWKLLVVLGVLIVAGVAAFLAIGPGGGDDDVGSGRPPAAGDGSGSSGRAPVDEEQIRLANREAEAHRALVAARSFREANPGEWASSLARFDQIVETYEGTQAALDARDAREDVNATWLRRASEVWTELAADVDRRLERREFDRAVAILDSFPEKLRFAEGFEKKVAERRERIRAAAFEAWTEAAKAAQKSAEELRFDEALKGVAPFRECGLEAIENEAREAHETIAAARDRVEGLRAAGREAFGTLYGDLVLTFGAEGYDAAFSRLEKARTEEVFRYAQSSLEEAGLDLNRMSAFEEAVRRGFEADEGGSVTLEMADGESAALRIEDVGVDGLRVRRGRSSELVAWSEISVAARAEVGLRERGAMRPESRFDAALWALSRGRIDVARQHLEAAESLGGDTKPYRPGLEYVRAARDARVEADLRVAHVHVQEGRLEEAEKLLDRVILFAPDHAGARRERGRVRAGLRRPEGALEDLREGVRLGADDPEIQLEIARLCEETEKLEEAVAAYGAYLDAATEGPDVEVARRRLGELRGRIAADRARDLRAAGEAAMRKREWQTAVDSFREADGLVPDDPETVHNLAISSHRLGRIFDAYVAYRRYLDLRPRGRGPREARKALASLETAYASWEKALGDFTAGEQAYNAGKYDEAIDHFDVGLEKAPLCAQAYYSRALAWYDKSTISGAGVHTRAAIEDFDRLLKIENDSGRALAGRALCWLQLKKYDSALEDARKAMALLPDDYISYNTAAVACASTERYKDAIDYYDEAIRRAPDYATLYISRARAKWALRRHDDALADLAHAKKLDLEPEQGSLIQALERRIRRDKEDSGG